MEILDTLYEVAFQKYPVGIECFDKAYAFDPKFPELTMLIKDERSKWSIGEVCKQFNQNFEGLYFRDVTYLARTNPCIRIELSYNKKLSAILISLLYPAFTITGEFKKEKNKVKSVLGEYKYVEEFDLKKINMNIISANQKLMNETTLFDCFFHDN